MFTNNPLGHDYNEPMVDRLLGKAYQTIKEVHESLPDIAQAIAVGEDSKKVTASVDKLTATLKGFKEGTGLFIGHDLGEVGVEDSKDTYIGDNFLSELTKSGTNVKTVGDNVSTINRLAEHINELKAIAEALTSLLTVKDSLNEVDTINQNIEKIKTVANNSSNINSVYDCLDNINALAGSINDFPELIEHGEDIATVAQHISYVVTLGSNIVGFHNRIVSLETSTDSLDKRLTAAENLNTSQSESLTDHERRIGNIETTTDVGQISVRIQAIEDKNVEQDTALDNETKTRIAKDTELESTINNLPNKYVTLDTRQNIPKKKTFTEPVESISIKDASFDVSTVPSTTVQHSFSFYDKNDNQIVVLQAEHNTNDEHVARLSAVAQNSENKKVFSQVSLSVKKDGTAIAIAPAPDDNSNGRNIATTAWVNTKISNTKHELDTSINSNANSITGLNSQITTVKENIANLKSDLSATNTNVTNLTGSVNTINSNYVTLATDQVISGRKVFNKEIILKQSSVIGTNDWGDNSLVFVDRNNQRYGYIQPRYDNGVNSLSIFVALPTDPTQVKGISVFSDGRFFVDGKQIKETVIESVRNGTNWYRVWSDGWIEQGGYVGSIAGAGATRINFFRAFQTTDYNISAGVVAASGIGHASRICVPERGVNYMNIDWSDGNYTDGCYWRVEGY